MNTQINHREATPTEYNHTLFRSKTEAVFARALDLSGHLWEYEPDWYHHGSGWVPDFFIASRAWRDGDTSEVKWRLFLMCMELKPSMPTDAYLNQLSQRFMDMESRLIGVSENLVVCNPFEPDEPRVFLNHNRGYWTEWSGKMPRRFFSFVDEARKFRFDLKGL